MEFYLENKYKLILKKLRDGYKSVQYFRLCVKRDWAEDFNFDLKKSKLETFISNKYPDPPTLRFLDDLSPERNEM